MTITPSCSDFDAALSGNFDGGHDFVEHGLFSYAFDLGFHQVAAPMGGDCLIILRLGSHDRLYTEARCRVKWLQIRAKSRLAPRQTGA